MSDWAIWIAALVLVLATAVLSVPQILGRKQRLEEGAGRVGRQGCGFVVFTLGYWIFAFPVVGSAAMSGDRRIFFAVLLAIILIYAGLARFYSQKQRD